MGRMRKSDLKILVSSALTFRRFVKDLSGIWERMTVTDSRAGCGVADRAYYRWPTSKELRLMTLDAGIVCRVLGDIRKRVSFIMNVLPVCRWELMTCRALGLMGLGTVLEFSIIWPGYSLFGCGRGRARWKWR